jgi:hypothetical protein
MGDFKSAIADYDDAILLDPNDDTAHENRARSIREMGRRNRSTAD